MSITSITIEHFKGIRDKVKIDLKPITLLFGPNSAGKSTIIQALHYAWEVIGRHNLDPNFTEFGGREMDLGGFENLVYGHDLSRPISIRLDMDMKGKGLPIYGNDEKRAFDETVFYGCGEDSNYDSNLIITYWECKQEIINAWVEIQVSWCELLKKFQVASYEVGLNNERIAKVETGIDSATVNIVYINFFHPLLVSDNKFNLPGFLDIICKTGVDPDIWMDKNVFSPAQYEMFSETGKKIKNFLKEDVDVDELKKIYENQDQERRDKAIKEIEQINQEDQEKRDKTERIVKEYLQSTKEDREKIDKKIEEFVKIYEKGLIGPCKPFLPYEFLFFCFEAFGIKSINEELKIECSGLIDALPNWDSPFHLNFKSKSSDYYAEALSSSIMQFIAGPGQILKDELQKLSYLGPIRSRIPRNYVPNRYVEKRNWPDGLAAWDVLHKEDAEIVRQTDFWMADRLKSGYHITRKTFKEIDLSRISPEQENILELYNASPAKTRLYLLDQKSGVEVQPPDVGVGISQVIPVIVSALYFKEGIVSIEQPELHIHPALQVTLGDLFISQIQEKGPCFLLETHSEHLMLRFLRRIRETNEGSLPEDHSPLTPDQLAIYYIEPGENGMTVSRIQVDAGGEFMDRWPRGFFNERVKELY